MAEGAQGGEDFVLAMEGVGEPVAKEDGADGEDVLGEGSVGDDGAGDAFVGLAGSDVVDGVGEDSLGAGGGTVRHSDWSLAAGWRGETGRGLEVVGGEGDLGGEDLSTPDLGIRESGNSGNTGDMGIRWIA